MIDVRLHSHSNSPTHGSSCKLIRWSVAINNRRFWVDAIVPLSGESMTIIPPSPDRIASAALKQGLNPFEVERNVKQQMENTSEIVRRFFSWGDPT